MTASTSSICKERRLRIKGLKEKMIDPTSIKSCNLLELQVIGDKIEEKEQNTTRFYFENLNGMFSGL